MIQMSGLCSGLMWNTANILTAAKLWYPHVATHDGPIFHYKANTYMYWQWEQYQVSIANLEPTIGTISSVMGYMVGKKHLVIS